MPFNPFFYGKTVSGSAFINRKDEIRQIASSLERGQSTIIFSPRRYGKTSLIKQVLAELEKKDLLVFYLDLYRITSIDRFAHYYSHTILTSLQSGVDKLFSLIRALIPSLKPKLTYTEPNLPGIELELSMESLQKQSTLEEMFNFLEHFCTKKKLRACVVFDEFQEITAFDSEGLLEREMRSAFQHHESVSYAFLGSKIHLMKSLFKDKNRPFYNFGTHVELDTIDQKYWVPFIVKAFASGGKPIPSETGVQIVAQTGGHPYYTQMLCSELWEQTVMTGNKLSPDSIEMALSAVLTKENHAFVELWDALSPAERRLCAALAETGPAAIYSSEFLLRYHLGASSTVQRIADRLMKKGIIDRSPRAFQIVDPFFIHWIRRGTEVMTGISA